MPRNFTSMGPGVVVEEIEWTGLYCRCQGQGFSGILDLGGIPISRDPRGKVILNDLGFSEKMCQDCDTFSHHDKE